MFAKASVARVRIYYYLSFIPWSVCCRGTHVTDNGINYFTSGPVLQHNSAPYFFELQWRGCKLYTTLVRYCSRVLHFD